MPSRFTAGLARDQLAQLVDILPHAIFIKDADSVLLHVNRQCAEVWGMDADALIGTTGAKSFPPEQVAAFLAKDRAVFEAGVPQSFTEVFWSARLQSNRTGKTTKVPIFDAQGRPQMLFGLTEDITDATETARALHATERSYRTLMEELPVGLLVHDPQGVIVMANTRAQDMLGLPLHQLLGKGLADAHWRVVFEGGAACPIDAFPVSVALATHQPVRDMVLGIYRPTQVEPVWLQVQADPIVLDDSSLSHVVVAFADISELRNARSQAETQQRVLAQQTAHVNAVLDNMADGVITISEGGRIESINQAACRMFGFAVDELIGHNVSLLMPMPHRSQHDGYLQHYQRTGEARVVGIPREVHGQRKDGRLFPMSLAVSKVKREDGVVFVGILRDITQRLHDEEEIRRLAFYDTLTGLPNRRLLIDRLRQAMLTSTRGKQHGALMFLDLDHFKQLNDTLGHDVGDELLRQVAQRIVQALRESDSVARLGGDEFVILLEELSVDSLEAAAQAEMVASKVLQDLGRPYRLHQHDYECTPSIGITLFMEDHETVDDLLKKADVAMYQAKSSGRNAFRFFDAGLQAATAARAALERDIRIALQRQEFCLHYQLQVDAQGGHLGVEALVRWRHPARGMVSPAQFIPLAEETGLIVPLGAQILRQACAQLHAWASDPHRRHWTVAVNVSALQMGQLDFVEQVRRVLAETQANPRSLKLELTESLLAKDMEVIILKMHALRALGVGFSLDDFGTGFSSLSYLKRLPMSQLKIDQSFVRDLETNPSDAVIARTVVALGHSLGLTVIAEGVETPGQRDFLAQCGCDAFQGYLYARPMPADDLIRLVDAAKVELQPAAH